MATNSDFFAAAPVAPAVDANAEDIDRFAQAIAGRFNNSDKALLTARLSPTHPQRPSTSANNFHQSTMASPATPMARMAIAHTTPPRQQAAASSSAQTSDITIITSSTLPSVLRTPHVLVLDIRPHSAYSAARLPNAISLSVPSTLLKRPAFTLQKLAAMLPSASSRSRFQSWSKASRILVYDADSSMLADGSSLLGLLRKFRSAGFSGDVAWLQGGIQSLWRDNRHLVDERAVSDDEDENEAPQFVRARDLPQAAFQQTTTMIRSSPTLMSTKSDVLSVAQSVSGSSVRLTAANPFYDNIRQNMELSFGITERIPLRLSPTTAARAKELPFTWLRNIVAKAGQDEGTEELAMQFYRIELGEQRRMQGIMAHHSMQSGFADGSTANDSIDELKKTDKPFPYSIVAGVEKGIKNRYKNIWPFEHSRVRLKDHEQDDYVNASFVHPLGTRRKFIATQGPLPSTFSDFWSVVWEQDVHIILMLTRECEAGSIKCGKYWAEGQYGPLRLKCVSVGGGKEDEDPGGSGVDGSRAGFFNAPLKDRPASQPTEDKEHNFTIRRVFELSHPAHPELKPRTITHLQYLGWPDMDVPVNPRSLLRLMFEVDELVDEDAAKSGHPERASPVLLHCSAGVGRTGAFIMIDAALDGVRCEIRKRALAREASALVGGGSGSDSSGSESESQNDSEAAMDVDSISPKRARRISFANSEPSKSTPLPPTPQALAAQKGSGIGLVTQTQTKSGPVATLPMGGNRPDRLDIHVPLVPSNVLPVHRQSLPTLSTSSNEMSNPVSSLLFRRRLSSSSMSRQPVTSDFTIADADSMFMSPTPNPAFAMDVESFRPSLQNLLSNNSSSGEGNGSGGDKASGSGSASSGSASDGRFTGPLQKAFANLSSADDVPGPSDRLKSPRFRHRFVGSDGTGSGEAGGSASESSAKCSIAGGKHGGGYSSTSSVGLGGFAGMDVSSPARTSAHGSPTSSVAPAPLANRQRQKSPRKLPMQKPSLLAPKPLHLKAQMPELTEGIETTVQSPPGPLPALGDALEVNPSSTRSIMSSSSSIRSSTDTLSLRSTSLSGNTTDTYDTPASMHKKSRSPSLDKEAGKGADHGVFDFTSPRTLNDDDSPPLLSSLEEPLRQILEDMREQRMSLCQSLRQYVFVHNAIIEGALIIAEQERKHLGLDSNELFESDSPSEGQRMIHMTGKRGASPTELPKEDKKGEVALAKRPSMKRGKSKSGGESTSPIST